MLRIAFVPAASKVVDRWFGIKADGLDIEEFKSHGENHLADGVLTYGKHTTDQKGGKNPAARSTEAQLNGFNPERIW